jgi:predicted ATPase
LAEISTRLATSFDVASGSTRTTPTRQQTLRATLEWSWNLLEPREQLVLRRLSAFAGGWTLAAALAVCGRDSEPPEAAVIDTLSQLVIKSLVIADHFGSAVRYRLLETVRAYAEVQLAKAGGSAAVLYAHATYIRRLAECTPLQAVDDAKAALLMREEDNVRAALSWAVDHAEAEVGALLANAAYTMWMFSGHYSEGVSWFDRVLALPPACGSHA